ncbi:MAG: hypothetical protein RL072_1341 [Actinomycetota bacterium]
MKQDNSQESPQQNYGQIILGASSRVTPNDLIVLVLFMDFLAQLTIDKREGTQLLRESVDAKQVSLATAYR